MISDLLVRSRFLIMKASILLGFLCFGPVKELADRLQAVVRYLRELPVTVQLVAGSSHIAFMIVLTLSNLGPDVHQGVRSLYGFRAARVGEYFGVYALSAFHSDATKEDL